MKEPIRSISLGGIGSMKAAVMSMMAAAGSSIKGIANPFKRNEPHKVLDVGTPMVFTPAYTISNASLKRSKKKCSAHKQRRGY